MRGGTCHSISHQVVLLSFGSLLLEYHGECKLGAYLCIQFLIPGAAEKVIGVLLLISLYKPLPMILTSQARGHTHVSQTATLWLNPQCEPNNSSNSESFNFWNDSVSRALRGETITRRNAEAIIEALQRKYRALG